MLENSRIKLRALEPQDVDRLYAWENNTEIWEVSNTLVPFSKYVLEKYVECSHFDIYETKQLRLMIDQKTMADDANTVNPRTIGMIDLFDFDPFHHRAGVGILIHNPMDRNKGMATLALDLLIQYAFSLLGLKQLYCNITPSNHASLKLFQNLGFEIAGHKKGWIKTQKGWEDEYLLQLLNKDWR